MKPSRRFSPKKGRECFYLVYLRMSERRDGMVLEVKVRSCELDSNQIQQDPGKLSQGHCHHLNWILIFCVFSCSSGKVTQQCRKTNTFWELLGWEWVVLIGIIRIIYVTFELTVLCLSSVLKLQTASYKSTGRTTDRIKTKSSQDWSCTPIIPKIWPRPITTMGYRRIHPQTVDVSKHYHSNMLNYNNEI